MQAEIASVSTKGQIVIPGAIRNRLGIRAGTRMVVISDGEHVLMKPVRTPDVEEFRSVLEASRLATEEAGLSADCVDAIIGESRRARRR